MTTPKGNRPVLIAGPTASGKSALAIKLAERDGGVVINADSMQVYSELAILTARPSPADEARVPHRLYGHVPARHAYSVAQWLQEASREIKAAGERGQRAIVVGGTGLYFMALTQGLSPIPEISSEVRQYWREAARQMAPEELHRILATRDPAMAETLRPSDPQRIVRALEVLESTGRSLAWWWQQPRVPVLNEGTYDGMVVEIDREQLYGRCDERFDAMLARGALEEVRALAGQRLDPELPAMRALGVAPLIAHLAGGMSREDAVGAAKRDTRHYVKRQITWLKRNMNSWKLTLAQ